MINYLLFYELLFRALCSQEAAERSGIRCERHSADNRQILSHQKADEVSHILGFFVFKFYQTCADGIDSILEDQFNKFYLFILWLSSRPLSRQNVAFYQSLCVSSL